MILPLGVDLFYPTYKIYIKDLFRFFKMAKRGRKKRENPLTEKELAQRRDRYNANRREVRRLAAAKLKEERKEWKEIGWVVRKMSIEAGFSQDSIWELLGGLVSRKKIQKWCAKKYEPP